jgi:hypothetical protein
VSAVVVNTVTFGCGRVGVGSEGEGWRGAMGSVAGN